MTTALKLKREPAVYVVGVQDELWRNIDQFLADQGFKYRLGDNDECRAPGEVIAETAGRLCYLSFDTQRPGGPEAYFQRIKEAAHGSVLEHAVISFIVSGIDRATSHELVRHRAGLGVSQLSQRYVDESEASYIVPPGLADEVKLAERYRRVKDSAGSFQDWVKREMPHLKGYDSELLFRMTDAGTAWLVSVEGSHDAYGYLSNYMADKLAPVAMTGTDRRKEARQTARSVLPNATETMMLLTFNARALRHVIEIRASKHADTSIRKLAVMLLAKAQEYLPELFRDYSIVTLPDGTEAAETNHRKV